MKCHLNASLVALIAVPFGLAVLAGPLFAHHGRGATYATESLTWEVTVTEVAWRNPHISFWGDVTEANGNVVNWGFEGPNVSTMTRQGWFRNTLTIGQKINVTFHRSESGAPVGLFRGVALEDGEVIFVQGGGATGVD